MTAGARAGYDPHARRDTPLALALKQRIARDGPVTVAAYMQACLQDAEHGYYVKRPAIGEAGDFVTAPEISQVFGELIGLWAAVVWQQMGSPARVNLFELGPGRGTLMADALRAARVLPAFLDAIDLALIDTNEHLRALQAVALAGSGRVPRWLDSLLVVATTDGAGSSPPSPSQPSAAVTAAPTIVIANEFLDARPVRQYVRRDDLWFERTVVLDERGALAFGCAVRPASGVGGGGTERPAAAGDIAGVGAGFGDLTAPLAELGQGYPVAALFLDYGHDTPLLGDTLQAVRGHAYEHPLTSPGEADLSTLVDFAAVRARFSEAGFAVDGATTQAEFLGRLGVVERAQRLMRANPARAGEIETGVARLMAPQAMGTRFKALGIRSPQLPPLPGF